MSHLTTRDRTVSPDGYAAALRILRRLLAGIERPPALRLGDMLLHELESHPEYTLIIRDPGLLRRLVLRTDPLLLAEAYFRGTIDILVMSGYALLATRLRHWLHDPKALKAQNRFFGGVFVGAGLLLASTGR